MKKIIIFGIVLLFVGMGFIMTNNQFISAGNAINLLYNDKQEQPMQPSNYTTSLYCNYEFCHDQFPQPWIEVNKIDETPGSVTYTVNGQTDTWPWLEGWAVLDFLENNIENGFGPGKFTLVKSFDNETYRVFWVDSDSELFGRGGANFTEIYIPPIELPLPPPNIDGPSKGYPGRTIEYQFVSSSYEGDWLFYFIDWDDGTFEDWFGPFPSGEVQTVSHIWSNSGIYSIKAKVRDNYGRVSDWAEFHVMMPRNKGLQNTLFLILLERFPLLQQLQQKWFGL
jgi:hypothetical protein